MPQKSAPDFAKDVRQAAGTNPRKNATDADQGRMQRGDLTSTNAGKISKEECACL
jgi:hypothetical protein